MIFPETPALPENVLQLETTREGLLLRQLTLDDSADFFESYNASRAQIAPYDGRAWTNYRTIEAVDQSIAFPQNPYNLRMGIRYDDKFVGSVSMNTRGTTEAEISYWVDSRHTNRGNATFAAASLARYAAQRYPYVIAQIDPSNEASAKVLKRAGFAEAAQHAGRTSIFELVRPISS